MWSRTIVFEWYRVQWPWVTSNPDFNVTILFNVNISKMVQDMLPAPYGTVSYCTVLYRAILTMADRKEVVWSISWCHFQWPLMILTQILRTDHYCTLNRSETIQDRHVYDIPLTEHDMWLISRAPSVSCATRLMFSICLFFYPGISSEPLNLSQQKFARWRQLVRNRTRWVWIFEFFRLGAKNVTFCPDLPGVTFTKYNMAPKRRTISKIENCLVLAR